MYIDIAKPITYDEVIQLIERHWAQVIISKNDSMNYPIKVAADTYTFFHYTADEENDLDPIMEWKVKIDISAAVPVKAKTIRTRKSGQA